MTLTITEALAEIKTIQKRIEKKSAFVQTYLFHQEGIKDPLLQQGGSKTALEQETQSMDDLQERIVTLRRGIQQANAETTITILAETRSIADWIIWRREVAPIKQKFLTAVSQRLSSLRDNAKRQGVAVGNPQATELLKPQDFIVYVNEQGLAKETEELENILGALDGQLSLKNATTIIKE